MSWPTTAPTNQSIQAAVSKAVKGLNEDPAAATNRTHAGFKLTHQGAPGSRKGYHIFVVAQRFDEADPKDIVAFVSNDKFEVSAKKDSPIFDVSREPGVKKAAKKAPAKKAAKKAAKKKA